MLTDSGVPASVHARASSTRGPDVSGTPLHNINPEKGLANGTMKGVSLCSLTWANPEEWQRPLEAIRQRFRSVTRTVAQREAQLRRETHRIQ